MGREEYVRLEAGSFLEKRQDQIQDFSDAE